MAVNVWCLHSMKLEGDTTVFRCWVDLMQHLVSDEILPCVPVRSVSCKLQWTQQHCVSASQVMPGKSCNQAITMTAHFSVANVYYLPASFPGHLHLGTRLTISMNTAAQWGNLEVTGYYLNTGGTPAVVWTALPKVKLIRMHSCLHAHLNHCAIWKLEVICLEGPTILIVNHHV